MTVLLITDPRWSLQHVESVIEHARKGARRLIVQLRDKESPDLLPMARRLRHLTSRLGVFFVVNGPLEIARAVGADGVHVPCRMQAIEEARAGFSWVSTPTHSDSDVLDARHASAILVSPIYDTPGKGPPRGEQALRSARASFPGEIFALGGVDAARAMACQAAGADGVAVMRALLDASDPEATARALDAPFFGV